MGLMGLTTTLVDCRLFLATLLTNVSMALKERLFALTLVQENKYLMTRHLQTLFYNCNTAFKNHTNFIIRSYFDKNRGEGTYL